MSRSLLVTNVTLIDGTGAPPQPDASLYVEDGRFTAIDGNVPSEADEVIDGAGLWAVPGLIDTHVHLSIVGQESLPVFLALGITTIRDLGGAIDLALEARRALDGGAPGPRLLFAGPFIDGDPPTLPNGEAMPDEDAVASAVRTRLDAGAEAIKLYSTLPPDKLRRAISEVAGQVPVTGHLGTTWASEAMEAGINGLEHALATPYNDFAPEELRTAPGLSWLAPNFWQNLQQGWLQADLNSDASRRWIDLLVEKDVSFCPTLTLSPGADERTEEELPFVRFPQASMLRARGRAPQPSPEARQLGRDARRKLQELVLLVHEAGGRVIAGTDTGPMQPPGFAMHREIRHLAEAGLSNMDVLRAATALAAEALWRDDVGAIEPGKRADFLLLGNDPLADIAAFRDIRRVVRDGVVHNPDDLLAMARSDAGER